MGELAQAIMRGRKCQICGAPAWRKVGEEIVETEFEDVTDPTGKVWHVPLYRHNYTAYVCERHFWFREF